MKLTLERATAIVDGALAKARETNVRPLCVAVLDDGGHLIALKRADGASILRPTIRLASEPIARTLRVSRSIATTEGSSITTPFPLTITSVFAVPRSIPMS